MIGGTDLQIEVPSGVPALDCAVRTIRLFWLRAVFENGDTADLSLRYKDMSFSNLREILVYKDLESFKKWEQLGADSSLDGTMIHLLASSNALTIVVDDQPSLEIQKIVHSIRHGLRMNSFGVRPSQEAA